MSEFLRQVGETLREYPTINFNRSFELQIQKIVLEYLDLKDLGKLRDRFEGQSFLEKSIRKISAYYSVLEYFGFEKPQMNINLSNDFNPIVNINGKDYDICVSEFGSFPKFRVNNFTKPIIFVLQKSIHTYSIAGVAELEILNDTSNFKSAGLMENDFISFNKLINISKI
jgi:hypothetical protein